MEKGNWAEASHAFALSLHHSKNEVERAQGAQYLAAVRLLEKQVSEKSRVKISLIRLCQELAMRLCRLRIPCKQQHLLGLLLPCICRTFIRRLWFRVQHRSTWRMIIMGMLSFPFSRL